MDNRKLCETPYNKTVDWAKWYIFWADERVVGKTHADSNYKLVKDGLLSKVSYIYKYIYIYFLTFLFLQACSCQFPKRRKEIELKYLVKHLLHFDFFPFSTNIQVPTLL